MSFLSDVAMIKVTKYKANELIASLQVFMNKTDTPDSNFYHLEFFVGSKRL